MVRICYLSFIQIKLYELNQSECVNVMYANWFYKS